MFELARPIWLKNKRTTKNLQVGFRCNFEVDKSKTYVLKVSGATFYRVFLNGRFVGYGPARAGHGYLRVDEIELKVSEGTNKLAIEVAGYNCSSFYSLPIKSFLCAEVLEDGVAIKYTGRDFEALSLEKLRNVYAYRYSYQRCYSEVWNLDNCEPLTYWQIADGLSYEKIFTFEICEKFIPRDVPIPNYDIISAEGVSESGTLIHKYWEPKEYRYIAKTSNIIDGYFKSDVTDDTISELYGDFIPSNRSVKECNSIHIEKDEYVIYKLPHNSTGFLINSIKALKDSSVYVFFSEYNYGNGMIFDSLNAQINIVKYNLKESENLYELESFEPYTCQYIGIAVTSGEIIAEIPKVREYCFPNYNNAEFSADDSTIEKVFAAAMETFRQNTLDIYMDCPSRERGGWLCDSYFTAQSEKFFSGTSVVEKVFLENFVMAEEFPNLPQGMLPMVYPSDIKKYNSGYIPQWAMWYIVELGEFSKNRENVDVSKYRTLCYELLEWLKKYENEDGLLEKMPGWNFVEWSKANDWVQDVNYPSNMLYAKMLSVMGEIFGDNMLAQKSQDLRQTILEQSFDGELFTDNAVRDKDGNLVLTQNHSETCQYYAYFFGIANAKDECFKKLTDMIINVFGPERTEKGLMPEVAFSNAFIGNYLRLIILLRLKQFDKALSDIRGYFGNMANLTGTLWEYNALEKARRGGSLNHGFASFAGVAIAYAMSGIESIDYNKKIIYMDNEYLSKINYSLKIGTNDGNVLIREKSGKKSIDIPKEWKIMQII